MSSTYSTMMPLGQVAPDFLLLDTVSDEHVRLEDVKSDKATVVLFICNHCPYVKHINKELVKLANEYIPKGVGFVAISSNDAVNYPDDAPDKMKQQAEKLGYPFPYLYDETQEVARAYDAACTPDIFVFDGELRCVYRGQFDDSRPKNDIKVTGNDLRDALDHILAGRLIATDQKPSMGCNIKWKVL